MNQSREVWKIHNKNRFLQTLMNQLAGNAHISFEGGASIQGLYTIDGASEVETDLLRRNTTYPRLSFVILPLEPQNLNLIWKGIGGSIARDVLHIQIEKDGQLAFAAYDSFDPGGIVLRPPIPSALLDSLMKEGLLERLLQ